YVIPFSSKDCTTLSTGPPSNPFKNVSVTISALFAPKISQRSPTTLTDPRPKKFTFGIKKSYIISISFLFYLTRISMFTKTTLSIFQLRLFDVYKNSHHLFRLHVNHRRMNFSILRMGKMPSVQEHLYYLLTFQHQFLHEISERFHHSS